MKCERVIRYMQRVAIGIPGDIRLFPLEESAWDAQIIITESLGNDPPGGGIEGIREGVVVGTALIQAGSAPTDTKCPWGGEIKTVPGIAAAAVVDTKLPWGGEIKTAKI